MRQVTGKGDILQIKITLKDVRPAVWRRVLVPATLTLRRLHETIQGAMGWSTSIYTNSVSVPAATALLRWKEALWLPSFRMITSSNFRP